MEKTYSAEIICNSTMMRQVIGDSLRNQGLVVLDEHEPACPAGHVAQIPDVAVVVSGDFGDASEIGRVHSIPFPSALNWVVLARERHDPITSVLTAGGVHVCVVPDDIGAFELAHVAMLAARGHDVTVGRFCDACTPDEIRAINAAGLDHVQWRLMTHLAEGHSNKVIARAEGTTEAAIKARIRCVLTRLRVDNRTMAAVIAARAGLRFHAPVPAIHPASSVVAGAARLRVVA